MLTFGSGRVSGMWVGSGWVAGSDLYNEKHRVVRSVCEVYGLQNLDYIRK